MRKPTNSRYTTAFKIQTCTAIRAGTMGFREAERTFGLSNSLLTVWLKKFDAGEFGRIDNPKLRLDAALEQRIFELERIVLRLTLENERLRSAIQSRTASNDNDGSKPKTSRRQNDPTTT